MSLSTLSGSFSSWQGKWRESAYQGKPTDPSHFGGFAPKNGAGPKSEMGEGAEGIAASPGGKDNGLRSREAHHVGISPQENCDGAAGKVGKGEGTAENGGGEPRGLMLLKWR
jgi:hypothetical protein